MTPTLTIIHQRFFTQMLEKERPPNSVLQPMQEELPNGVLYGTYIYDKCVSVVDIFMHDYEYNEDASAGKLTERASPNPRPTWKAVGASLTMTATTQKTKRTSSTHAVVGCGRWAPLNPLPSLFRPPEDQTSGRTSAA